MKTHLLQKILSEMRKMTGSKWPLLHWFAHMIKANRISTCGSFKRDWSGHTSATGDLPMTRYPLWIWISARMALTVSLPYLWRVSLKVTMTRNFCHSRASHLPRSRQSERLAKTRAARWSSTTTSYKSSWRMTPTSSISTNVAKMLASIRRKSTSSMELTSSCIRRPS